MKIKILMSQNDFKLLDKDLTKAFTYHSFLTKIYSHSWNKFRVKCPIRVLKQKASFPDAGVSKSQKF